MEINNLIQQLQEINRRRRNRQRILRVIAMIVVFVTTYALILPAITLESPAVCGLTEHIHTEQCYVQQESVNCTLPEMERHFHTDDCWKEVRELVCSEHIHDQDCISKVMICQQMEAAAHTHDATCKESITVCDNEHEHTSDCCKVEEHLICGQTETTGHLHEAACFEERIICTLEENKEHVHGENCYTTTKNLICGMEESEGHSHADDPSESVTVLICELPEHTHMESCYPASDMETNEETVLPEGDPNADLETQEIWEGSLAAAELSGDPAVDVVRIARTQLGYEESRLNFIYDENNTAFGYSRYGQWVGQPYCAWNGAFVSFCLYYGGVEGMEPTESLHVMLNAFREKACYRVKADYMPASGDVIFLDRNNDGNCDEAGIVEEILNDNDLQVICGAVNGRVDRVTVSVTDTAVMGFGVLMEEPEMDTEYFHENEDGSMTQVQFTGETQVPQNAQLRVTQIASTEDGYLPMVRQIEDILDEKAGKISLLDISFYDQNGSYLSVQDTAQVVMDLDIGDADPKNIKVFHFVDGAPVELDTVSLKQTEIAVMSLREQAPPQIHTQLTFKTDGFSVFAVVEIAEHGDRILVTDLSVLADNSFYIVSNNQNYVMTDIRHYNGRGLDKGTYAGTEYLNGQTAWTFLQVTENTFRIRSSNGHYLVMEDTSADAAKLYTTDVLEEATVFTLRANNNQVEIGYNGPNGIAHYLNVYGGDQDFCGWKDDCIQDTASKVYLHLAEATKTLNTANSLGGKTFALLNSATKKAISPSSVTVNGVPGLQSVITQTMQSNGKTYYSGEVPVWTFEATQTEGVYHVFTQDGENKQYLRMLDTYYNGDSTVSKGSLTVGDTPQDIYVTTNTDGTVYLFVRDGANTGYINLDQSGSGSFWVYNLEATSNKLLLAEKKADAVLRYKLTKPDGVSWRNTPGVAQSVQLVTHEPVFLQSLTGGNAVGTFVDNNLYARSGVVSYYNSYNNSLGENLTPENYRAPGGEYRFLGWSATVDGVTYHFAQGAAAVWQNDGIHILDIDGVERILPDNTELSGRWEKVSDVVLFFVNYGATMLEEQDNKVITSYDSGFYTGIAAIAHIYNETTINPDKIGSYDVISREHDALIQAEIVPTYDPANTGTQIVIDAVASINSAGTGFDFVSVSNYNQKQLENAVSLYLQNDPNTSTQVKIDNAYVDKKEITAENYKLYWYLQKEVSDDGWHIDGVLVAKTFQMEIYKTFSGLTAQEAESAINQMSFPLSLISTYGLKQTYTTLRANASQPGVYTNDGKQSEGNIYKWTLQSILGQRYAFAETGHLIDGHDWSGLVSVHYTDGTVEYHYNTDTTYGTTDLYNGKLVGGEVESVIFANFYTQSGTGAFSVSKVADDAGKIRLPGARFTLTGVTNPQYSVTYTTNENGAVHFADLQTGTYTLTETGAPDGYQSTDDTWTVTVTAQNNAVLVTIRRDGSSGGAVTVYDSANGGIQEVYLIKNEPEDTTVTINKYFGVISAKEIRDLTDYAIEVRDNGGAVRSVLTFANAAPITGAVNGYTWTINLECDAEYTLTERNFLHENYLDTVVTAQLNNTALETVKTDADGDGISDTAVLTIQKGDSADTVNITNTYTNTFKLKIRKVDATGNYAPMQGVEFNIYGSFSEATGSESLEYVDSNGITHMAYLIGKTAPTDENGITWYDNMKLSAGTRSFIYVVDEVVTPAGYVELDEPIVRMVEVDGENYANGVYTLTVENFKRDLADVSVTAIKEWNIPDDMIRSDVKLRLYRKDSDGSVVQLQEVILDGTDKRIESSGITAEVTGWTVVWRGLSYAADETRYEYYVSEEPMAGYHVSYDTAVTTLRVGTNRVDAAIAEGSNLKRSVTVINSSGYTLPNTGGAGIGAVQLPGLVLLVSAIVLLWQEERKRQRRGTR